MVRVIPLFTEVELEGLKLPHGTVEGAVTAPYWKIPSGTAAPCGQPSWGSQEATDSMRAKLGWVRDRLSLQDQNIFHTNAISFPTQNLDKRY